MAVNTISLNFADGTTFTGTGATEQEAYEVAKAAHDEFYAVPCECGANPAYHIGHTQACANRVRTNNPRPWVMCTTHGATPHVEGNRCQHAHEVAPAGPLPSLGHPLTVHS